MISSPEEKETYKESDKIKRARARLSLSPEEIVIAKESNTFNRARARLILSPEERVIDKESDTFNRAIARGFLSEERKEFIADLEKKNVNVFMKKWLKKQKMSEDRYVEFY